MSDVSFPQSLLGSPEEVGDVESPFYHFLASESGPDDWHRFALGANWDQHGQEVFEWIAGQAKCERATALTLFWKSSPDFAAEFPDADFEYRGLAEFIRNRWTNGEFTEGSVTFDADVDLWPIDRSQLAASFGDRVDELFPASMLQPIAGRRLDTSDDIEGIPRRFWPEEWR